MPKNKNTESTANREICAIRLFDAPPELLWKVWTEPQHIAQWWGPNGFTNTIHTMDVRPGGEWDFVMHGPDGTDYKNKVRYVEIVPEERIVYDHLAPKFRVTVTFEAEETKTKLTMRMVFETAEERDAIVKKHNAVEGLNQTLGKLEKKLANVSRNKKVVLTREFDAPRALVFKAWTDPKHVQQWWGPRQYNNPVCEWNAQPGGRIYIDMRGGPDNLSHPCKGVFHTITPPERLVFTITTFEDENGNPKLEVLNTVTIVEERGRTKMTLVAHVLRATSDLAGPLSGMDEGWSQTLDKLGEVIARSGK